MHVDLVRVDLAKVDFACTNPAIEFVFFFTSEQHGRLVYEAAFSTYGVNLLTSRSMAIAGDLEFTVDKTIHS